MLTIAVAAVKIQRPMPDPSKKPPRTPKLSPAKLRDAFIADLEAAWTWHRSRRADQTPYAFVLYGVEGAAPRLWPRVLTEQGLTRVAQRYVEQGYYDTLDEARHGLRYSLGDAPDDGLNEQLPTVEPMLAPHDATTDERKGYRVLAKAATDALAALDAKGLFGAGAAREQLLLVIITEDTEDDFSTPSAKKLNPPAVFARFKEQTKIEGVFKSCDALAVAPDGRSLYAAGSRDRGGRDDSINEIVAFDLAGPRLKRRWVFEHPTKGDSVRFIRVAPDGRSVFVARTRYVGDAGEGQVLLMQFAVDSNAPRQQRELPGEASGFAISPDGTRCAVTTHGRELYLLATADLRVLHERKLDARPYGLHFPDNDVVLVATPEAILRIDPAVAAPPPPAAIPVPAHRLSADAAGTMLAVSRWFQLFAREEQKKEFGVHLLRLPSFEPLREFVIPNHEAVTATLSADGKLLACEAHEIGKPRKFIAVFDTATGRQVARRKSDFIRDIEFLPDNRTLAIAVTGHTTGESVVLWTVPLDDAPPAPPAEPPR